ncbi:hypothetical protein [Pseudoalteromonas sp. T1lg75]|uniref:hypothetical protein n=1 Tax=Pseudoalteromonas sp. T1lg75 TaxID=2077102 RepID=UPI000CF5F682|nr:hypothetical protein [Pseudoalteromonas sp. T1lg75]
MNRFLAHEVAAIEKVITHGNAKSNSDNILRKQVETHQAKKLHQTNWQYDSELLKRLDRVCRLLLIHPDSFFESVMELSYKDIRRNVHPRGLTVFKSPLTIVFAALKQHQLDCESTVRQNKLFATSTVRRRSPLLTCSHTPKQRGISEGLAFCLGSKRCDKAGGFE